MFFGGGRAVVSDPWLVEGVAGLTVVWVKINRTIRGMQVWLESCTVGQPRGPGVDLARTDGRLHLSDSLSWVLRPS